MNEKHPKNPYFSVKVQKLFWSHFDHLYSWKILLVNLPTKSNSIVTNFSFSSVNNAFALTHHGPLLIYFFSVQSMHINKFLRYTLKNYMCSWKRWLLCSLSAVVLHIFQCWSHRVSVAFWLDSSSCRSIHCSNIASWSH